MIGGFHYGYWGSGSVYGNAIRGFYQFPNNRKLIYGVNDFTSSAEWKGYIYVTDTLGYATTLFEYDAKNVLYQHVNSSFNDLVKWGNKMVVLGTLYNDMYNSNGYPMLLFLDTNLNPKKVVCLPVSFFNSLTPSLVLNKLNVIDNKLFISGYIRDSITTSITPVKSQILGYYDSTNNSFKGHKVSLLAPFKYTNAVSTQIIDSNSYLVTLSPYHPNDTMTALQKPYNSIIAKVVNDSISFCKLLSQKNNILTGCSYVMDSIIFYGYSKDDSSNNLGYLGHIPLDTNNPLCNFQNTMVKIDTFNYFLNSWSLPAKITRTYSTSFGWYDSYSVNYKFRNPCDTTDVKDITTSDRNDIVIYPQPTNDLLFIKTNFQKPVNIKIFDLNGKELLVLEQVTGTMTISTKSLNLYTGVYLLSIQTQKENYWKKVIVEP